VVVRRRGRSGRPIEGVWPTEISTFAIGGVLLVITVVKGKDFGGAASKSQMEGGGGDLTLK